MKNLRFATVEENDIYIKEAFDFVDSQSVSLWASYKGIAITAIAEFIAQKDGITLYEELANIH